jgi:hypothetical protein
MSTPNVLDMETAPETANYRKSRLAFWTQIHKSHGDYRASALKHGASKSQADEAAGRDARGQVRWLVGELLTHAPGEHAAAFITSAPREWGQRAEILLDADPIVPDLIAHAYPVTSWAARLDTLTKQVAADDATWQRWIERMLPALSPFGVTHEAMSSVFGLVDNVGRGLGGLGEGVGDVASGFGRALGYLPWAIGALGLGAAILGAGYLTSGQRRPAAT